MKIKCAGIYKIEHISGYYYIGLSIDVFQRFSSHYTDIKLKKHSSIEFMNLWFNSVPSEWTFQILEYISMSEFKRMHQIKGKEADKYFRLYLHRKEKEWMKKFSKNWALNKNKRYFS
jgi:hypothetical protein